MPFQKSKLLYSKFKERLASLSVHHLCDNIKLDEEFLKQMETYFSTKKDNIFYLALFCWNIINKYFTCEYCQIKLKKITHPIQDHKWWCPVIQLDDESNIYGWEMILNAIHKQDDIHYHFDGTSFDKVCNSFCIYNSYYM